MTFEREIKGDNDRIENEDIKFKDFRHYMQSEFEQIKKKYFVVSAFGKIAFIPYLAFLNKFNNVFYLDSFIVCFNSSDIV